MSSLRAFVPLSVFLFFACPSPKPPPPPEPGPLQAGVATRKLDLPVGIALGGYLRQRPASDPGSPWAEQFPASQGIHTEPTVRVVALTNGLTRIAFIRLDTAITTPTLRSRLISTLGAAGETANVFLFATHTHAGPARIMPPARLGSATGTDFVSLVMDHYDAEVETRMTSRHRRGRHRGLRHPRSRSAWASPGWRPVTSTTIAAARTTPSTAATSATPRSPSSASTRWTRRATPVKPLTALLHYAMHGTVLGSDNTLQSTEAPGALRALRLGRPGRPRDVRAGRGGRRVAARQPVRPHRPPAPRAAGKGAGAARGGRVGARGPRPRGGEGAPRLPRARRAADPRGLRLREGRVPRVGRHPVRGRRARPVRRGEVGAHGRGLPAARAAQALQDGALAAAPGRPAASSRCPASRAPGCRGRW